MAARSRSRRARGRRRRCRPGGDGPWQRGPARRGRRRTRRPRRRRRVPGDPPGRPHGGRLAAGDLAACGRRPVGGCRRLPQAAVQSRRAASRAPGPVSPRLATAPTTRSSARSCSTCRAPSTGPPGTPGDVVELISDEIERISGHPPTAFIASTRRTLLSIVHADDLERVEHVVEEAAENEGAFALEYRIVRADGEVRWVLDRGHVARGTGGTWIDGALFDVTERRRAEEALRIQEIEDARTEELRASRVRIVQAADAARRRIERDLHDGAQQRLVAMALDVRLARRRLRARPVRGRPLPRAPRGGARAGLRGAARARARHPPGGAHRSRAGARARRARRPLPVAVEVLAVPDERLPARRRRRSTSRSPRRSRTSPSTPARARRASASPRRTASSSSTCAMTASAARARRPAPGSAA